MRFPNQIRRGALSVAVTAAILVAVLLLNVGATALFGGGMLFWDMTEESMYRLNKETVELMKQTVAQANETAKAEGEEAVKVEIIFCADPDLLVRNEKMRYVYYTARALAKKFPATIRVRSVDVWSNPSAVNAYRVNSYSTILQTDVIVTDGNEYRVLSQNSFYTFSSATDTEPWAYSGEKNFVKAIRSITRLEMPVCCVTVNHGEPLADPQAYSALLETVKGAGYQIQRLDLATQEIPENCRMILIFDPQTDFTSGNVLSGNGGELGKLDVFLRGANSLFLFAGSQTPELPNLEVFLEEWGIRFSRYYHPENELQVLGNYQVVSPLDSVDGADGAAVIAEYETAGAGASLTQDMRAQGASPKVIFPNAMPLLLSPTYIREISPATEQTERYEFGIYQKGEEWREVYSVFRSPGNDRMTYAKAVNDGKTVTDAGGNPVVDPSGNFLLATFTLRYNYVKEGNLGLSVDQSSKVCVFGSTGFAENDLLQSNAYGNTDLLLGMMGALNIGTFPVGFVPERLHQTQMDSNFYTDSANRGRTVALALIPATIAAGLGIWVLVRRRRVA